MLYGLDSFDAIIRLWLKLISRILNMFNKFNEVWLLNEIT